MKKGILIFLFPLFSLCLIAQEKSAIDCLSLVRQSLQRFAQDFEQLADDKCIVMEIMTDMKSSDTSFLNLNTTPSRVIISKQKLYTAGKEYIYYSDGSVALTVIPVTKSISITALPPNSNRQNAEAMMSALSQRMLEEAEVTVCADTVWKAEHAYSITLRLRAREAPQLKELNLVIDKKTGLMRQIFLQYSSGQYRSLRAEYLQYSPGADFPEELKKSPLDIVYDTNKLLRQEYAGYEVSDLRSRQKQP